MFLEGLGKQHKAVARIAGLGGCERIKGLTDYKSCILSFGLKRFLEER
jgi:hypothetical protein